MTLMDEYSNVKNIIPYTIVWKSIKCRKNLNCCGCKSYNIINIWIDECFLQQKNEDTVNVLKF